jgi:hypothetical protein
VGKRNYQILFIYLLGLVFLYPIVAHTLMYELGYFVEKMPHGQYWLLVQVLLSAPGMIILGLILFIVYGQIKPNKYAGIIFILIGLFWLYNLISDIIDEAG